SKNVAKADATETATFSSTYAAGDYNNATQLILRYTSSSAWNDSDNGNLASKVYIDGELFSVDKGEIRHWGGQKWIRFRNLTGITTGSTLEIADGATFGGVIIPAMTFRYNGESWSRMVFVDFSNIQHNNVNYGTHCIDIGTVPANGIYATLKFSENFSAIADSTNFATSSYAIGTGLKINGVSIKDISGAFVDAAHGNDYMSVYVPFTGLSEYHRATLTVDAGTEFRGKYLNAFTVYAKGSGQNIWSTTANAKTAVNFSNIQWNNINYEGATFGGAGVLLNYGADLSTISSEINGGMKRAELKSFYGKYITLNGETLDNIAGAELRYHSQGKLWIYAPDMTTRAGTNAKIEIAANAPFLDAYLPALTLYWNGDNAWQVANPNPTFSATVNSWVANGWFIAQFDTGAWTHNKVPTSYTGIKYNGNDITDLCSNVKFYLTNGLWFVYNASDAKLAANYNGYSHPTIEIEENATVVYDGFTTTLPALTLYYNSATSQWQTEEPETEIIIPDLGTPDCDYTGITLNNSSGIMSVFNFRSFVNIPIANAEYTSTAGYYIRYNGTRLTEVSGAHVYTWENQCWLRIDIQHPTEGSVLTIEEGTPFAGNYLPKLIFKLIDGIWCKAFAVNITVDSDTYTVYSKDDVPVIINDEYFETLLSARSVPAKAVGFSVRGVRYKAGTTFKALTDTDIEVLAIGFDTSNGASVRLKTPTGIRFETRIDKADYDALVARVGSANVETGTYILPRSFLTSTDFRSYFADNTKISGTDYVKIVNSGFFNKETADSDGYYKFYGSLVNIKPNNYCTDFFGIGYIKITDGDNEYTVFGGYDLDEHTRTIYYVSSIAYPDFGSESLEKSVLKGYLDGVVRIADNVEISDLIDVDGYISPYNITYNAQTGVYTVAGNAEIKSVIIGDKKRINTRTNTLTVNGDMYYITDYNLTASAQSSMLTFKLSHVENPLSLLDFIIEVPSDRGVKILQLTDTEIIDAMQMRTSGALTQAQQEEYARKNIYA
ncbi:MAG: hypothetical protein J6Y43_06705, partial [Clostridia bacterium]|nr:hypothetical protein [Clostridia bacterium]